MLPKYQITPACVVSYEISKFGDSTETKGKYEINVMIFVRHPYIRGFEK